MYGSYNLELDGHEPEVDDLHRGPHQEVGFQRRYVDVLELAGDRTLSAALGNGHESEEARKAWGRVSGARGRIERVCALPTGANRNWSKATRLRAGTRAAVLVTGKVLERNANHLCCSGVIKNG